MDSRDGLFSLAEIRANIERQDFDAVPDEVVLALVQAVEAAQQVCKRLDDALKWNYENDRRQAIKELQFAIGATLSMREPLDRFAVSE